MCGRSTVGDVMTPAVVAVGRDASFREAAAAMCRRHVGALPVPDAGGRVTGIVSGTDPPVTEEERGTRSGHVRTAAVTAGDLMTAPAVTIPQDAPVPLAARRAVEGVVGVRCDLTGAGTRRVPGVPAGAAAVSDDRPDDGHDPRRHR